MPMGRAFTFALLISVTIGVGCRRDESAVEPVDAPVAKTSSAPAKPTGEQRVAIERLQATGAGIEFDEAGFPVRIDLASERVFADEELLRAALQFPKLQSLRLAVSSIPDATLAEVATLTKLEELFLQDAVIDDARISGLLQAMPNLRRLTLRRVNGVTDDAFHMVAGCESLEVVALIEMNELTGAGLEHLAAVPRLRSLDLRNCGRLVAKDLTHLAAFKGLVEVKLGGPAINDQLAEVILSLPQVRSLTIEDAEISAVFLEKLASDEATAERLQTLSFARCFGVSDQALTSIGRFSSLETLSLRDIMVSGEFLETLSEAGKGPLPLKTLIATNAFLNDSAVGRLPTLTPNLERLDLRGNMGITEESGSAFEKLKNLKDLKLE